MYDMFFDDYKYDDGEFTEICDLEKLKEIQKTRIIPGTCPGGSFCIFRCFA